MHWKTWLALGLAPALGLILFSSYLPFGLGSSEKSVNDHAYFFRLTANYMHGDEPVDFDIVVGCGVRVTIDRDNERSFDAVRDPLIFAKATRDGAAVMQIVPDACRGETTRGGEVPADFLPGAVWFDSKDDLSFGIGYVSEDAFENPRSRLKFLGAEIRPASQAEWEGFRPIAATNLVTSAIYTYGSDLVPKPTEAEIEANLWNVEKLKQWLPWLRCHGIQRIRLSDPRERAQLDAFRPAAKPRYWRLSGLPEGGVSRMQMIAGADGKDGFSAGAGVLHEFRYTYSQDGFPTRSGGGRFFSGRSGAMTYAPEILPLKSPRGLPWLDKSVGTAPVITFDVDSDGGRNLGFVYCYRELRNGTPLGDVHLPGYLSRRFMTRVDGQPVFRDDGRDSAFSQGSSADFFEDDGFYYFKPLEFGFQ